MASNSSEEHAKPFSQESYEKFRRTSNTECVNYRQSLGIKSKLNDCKDFLAKCVAEVKRDYKNNPKGVVISHIVALLLLALGVTVVINLFTGNSIFGFAPRTEDHWTQRIELKGMELSQDQVIHGEAHSDMFYVDGQIDGKPELFVYYRYVDDRGVVQDKFTPRKDVELVEDLPAGSAAVVEFDADYSRVMTTNEVENKYRRGNLPADSVFGLMFVDKKKAVPEKQPRPCFTEVETCEAGAKTSDTKPWISIHLPKGTIIKHIDPNTIHRGGK